MIEITIPQLGESIVEATIGHWLKQPGEAVTAGEPVLEIETDKVTMEVVAPKSGVLASVRKQEGDTATVGEVVATLEEGHVPAPGASTASTASTAPPATAPEASAPVQVASAQGTPADAVTPTASAPPGPGTAAPVAPTPMQPLPPSPGRAAPPPSVRRLAKAYGVDVDRIAGSGPHGQVTREDVEAAARAATAPVPGQTAAPQAEASSRAPEASAGTPLQGPETAARESRARMSRRRLTIARQLVRAQHEAAMLTTFNEVDMSAILAVRKERREAFKEAHGVSLGFMSFFVRATVGALKQFPRLNAEIQGEEIVLKQHYDIGIAVATEEGLVVPVLRDADRLNFAEIEVRIAELAERARRNALTLEDLRGGTFTITNGGVFGSLFSTPILNPPQVGILGMHAVQERPVAVGGKVEVRPMMYVALSYDHRIVDGSEAVRFLVTVKRLCEDPVGLLLEG